MILLYLNTSNVTVNRNKKETNIADTQFKYI